MQGNVLNCRLCSFRPEILIKIANYITRVIVVSFNKVLNKILLEGFSVPKYSSTHLKETINAAIPTEIKCEIISGLDIKL